MKGIENVSLVREQSKPAVYLIVGDTKFWIIDQNEFKALGFDRNKIRVVDDGALNGLTERRLHAPPAIRPSDVFFDCGQDYWAPEGNYYWNCLNSAFLVRKDVLVAGWLHDPKQPMPHVNVPGDPTTGVEDVHYNLALDAVFLDRMYGPNGLSTALQGAVWPGNPLAPTPIPFATGVPKGANFNSWILPGNDYDLHGELNAWHVHRTGSFGTAHYVGRGPQPAFWVNNLKHDPDAWLPFDAWFPFDPFDPEGTGRSLHEGDYIIMRGALWQDLLHPPAGPNEPLAWWNTGPTVNQNGWTEMHPIDWITRVDPPRPNARLTTTRVCLISRDVTGPQQTQDLSIWPDFKPPGTTRALQVRSMQGLIDSRFTNGASLVSLQENRSSDHVGVHIGIQPTGTQQARFKATWLVGWSEIDQHDLVWVNDQPPTGATLHGDGEGWDWSTENAFLFGQSAHRSAITPGMHQHYFLGATSLTPVVAGDTLFAMVHLDPESPPDEVMLQWHTTDWLSRAYWGDNLLAWGADGTAQRRYMGPLPRTGEWVRLEVPAALVGLGGTQQAPTAVDGMAFTLFGGKATWAYAGVRRANPLNKWAIVLCSASDVPPGPNSRERWVEFFTATNTDPGGAFAYWRDILYGIADLTGSQVFGWYDIGHTSNELKNASRQQTFDWGLKATTVDLTAFAHKIIIVNASTDHGKTGGGVLFGYEDSRALEPTFMFQQMGLEMGLDPSFGENLTPCASGDSRPGAYCDSWDLMSAMAVSSYQDVQNRRSGPGLNAPNLQRLGIVDRARIWSQPTGWFIYGGITLAAINRPDVAGYLMITFPGPSQDLRQGALSTYYIEFRQRSRWDRGLPTDAVLIHEMRWSDGLSRLLTNWNGGQLKVGQPFSPPGGGVVVRVDSIDSTASQATLSVSGVVPSKIMARSSRKVLDVTGGPGATGDGVPIQQWADLGATNQQWLFLPVGSGIYRIMARSSGKVLDVTGGPAATGNGVPIQQWADLGATNQQWDVRLTGDGTYFKIVSQSSGKVLDVRGGPSAGADGVQIQQWQDLNATNQQWYLIPVGSIYKIVSRSSGKVLDVRGGPGATSDGVPVQQWSDLGGTNQRWLLEPADSGYFQIVAESSGKVLDVTGGPTAIGNGVPIQQWTYNGTTNQQWQLVAVDRGFYKIVSRSSGKVLDVRGGPGATGDGVPIQQWDYIGWTNQQWQLVPIDTP